MQYQRMGENPKTFCLVLEKGDEVLACLSEFAASRKLGGAYFMAIGAFSSATLAYYLLEEKRYSPIPVPEQVEVTSLLGNVSLHNGEFKIHAHATLGKPDGSLVGGHLLAGTANPTLEMMLVELEGALPRHMIEEAGLPLIRFPDWKGCGPA